MAYLGRLFTSRAFYMLVPDQGHTVLTAGFESGTTYAAAARASDGSSVIAYIPTRRTVTIDLSQIAGTSARAWWFNPRTAETTLINTYPTTGSTTFTPPDANDWVLVLDNASLDLPAPGTSSPYPNGHVDYCRDYGPCGVGEGDCDGDGECESGLICAQNVGADYGFPADYDVCEDPYSCPYPNGHVDYCRDCGPCGAGEGDCDGDGECESGLICAQDVGADYGFSATYDVCEQPYSCPYPNGHVDYCRDCGPCGAGEGDCDGDGECESGLICAQDVGADYGFSATYDVCEQPDSCPYPNGHVDYCRDCGPCGAGQGDCDGDGECESGLICAQDVGADYGFPATYDVCEHPYSCPYPNGHVDYCRDCGPCGAGQGDCDGDGECESGLICAQDVGADYGFSATYDVCEQPDSCPYPNGHVDYCRDCGPCGAGQGDCDGDGECESGLICAQDVGADYGFSATYDVCEEPDSCPYPNGHVDYCRDCGPCGVGQGDCDGDGECESGLICAQDVGADYGFSATYDVCEEPDSCPYPNGHVDYCRDCGPCGVGQGDCDGDGECESGLICAQDVGADYGFSATYDVCEQPDSCPYPNGHVDYCRDCGPCGVGQGDCDGDGECESGLICAQDVGADYGFSADL